MKKNNIKTPQNKIWFGISRKLTIVFLVLIILPVIIIGNLMINLSSKTIEEKLKTFTVESLKQMGENMDSQIQTLDSIASSVLTNDNVMSNLKNYSAMELLDKQDAEHQIRTWLTGLSDLNMEVSGIYLFDRANNFFYTKGRSPMLGYSAVQQDWYKSVIEANGALVIFGTHEQFHVVRQPDMVITVARALKDFITQKPFGVIMLDIPYEFLESVFKRTNNLIHDTGTYVLDNDGTILFSQDTKELFSEFPTTLNSSMMEESGMIQAEISGEKAFAVYYTSPYTGWKIVSIQSHFSVLGGLDQVNLLFFIMIAAFLVLFLGLVFYVNRRLIYPIKEMSKATNKVKQGEYGIVLEFTKHDEITILADGLTSMAGHIEELINKVYFSQLLQKEAELTALQNQINPHFLYNTLECIRGMALENNAPHVADMVKALSAFTRYNIMNSRDFVTISDEINQIKNYMTIQNTRHDGKFNIVYNIPCEYLDVKIMKLTLQPLVENSIKHGLERKLGNGTITISISEAVESKDDLEIRISDDGLGMKKEKIDELNESLKESVPALEDNENSFKQHIGVINVHNRIRLYFGERYGLQYMAVEGGGMSVTIRVPKKGGHI